MIDKDYGCHDDGEGGPAGIDYVSVPVEPCSRNGVAGFENVESSVHRDNESGEIYAWLSVLDDHEQKSLLFCLPEASTPIATKKPEA